MGQGKSTNGAKMGLIVATTDDFRPSLIPLWESTWDKLKEKHPLLKVTVFVAPFNQEFGVNEEDNISNSQAFKEWFIERIDWVIIELHGFDHTKPPENIRSEDEQERIVKSSIFALRDYIDVDYIGYKAPFFQANSTMTTVLARCGIKWYDQWYHLNFVEPNKKPIPPHLVIPTHTNMEVAQNPDQIDKIYDELDKKLTELEDMGWKYSTYRQIMWEVLN